MNAVPSSGIRPDKLKHVEESLANIREALLSLRYGSIAITIHEDRIVQIDVTEKKRLKPN
ncbi:MAG: YezD family protein [Novosphingobium sp.]|uniref:YezD family protein n=1 Tax=Tsuneonella sp. CC-YZS046 TaxID=3042152 RepID=UPI002D7880EE|nr:YezD family protein [Tsuneonella sp. CC-YZS046]WRO65264.1 YezD family protein [Tsuneonella sp. CC-YZS046]